MSRQPCARAPSEAAAAQSGTTPLLLQSSPPLSPSEHSRGKNVPQHSEDPASIFGWEKTDFLSSFFAFSPFAANLLPSPSAFSFDAEPEVHLSASDLFGRVMMINAATDADDLPSLFVCGIANVSTYKFLQSISSLEYDDELWLVKAYCKTLREY